MRRAAFALAVTVFLCMGLSCLEKPRPPERTDAYPLAKGAYWVYRGTVRWTPAGGSQPRREHMTWRSEVVETVSREHVAGFVLRGFPADLSWYEEGKKPSERLVVRVGTGLFYLLEGERVQSVLGRLRDDQDLLQDLVRESELFLDLPLAHAKVFGETQMISRTDLSYCWNVEAEASYRPADLKGPPPPPGAMEYAVGLRTRPDHQVLKFSPGVGVTGYTYIHHGTVSECDLTLVEWGAGER